jgi:hypothetical protein
MLARKCVERSIFALWFATGPALPLLAQGVGAIGGTVMDTSGAVLPGATVTLSTAQGTVGSNQETVTDARGAYQFIRLVPGTYSVRAQLPSFRPVRQADILVTADNTARADLRLDIGALEEAIVVSGGAPLLDTTTALTQTVISRQELDELPNRTDVWSIARVLPGVIMDKIDVGGTERFLQSTPIVRGSNTENKSMIDGMDISSLTGNGTGVVIYLDPYAFEETNIQMGAGSAESSAGGINFNMITRSGTNQFHGGILFNGTTPALARSRNYSPELRTQLLGSVPAKALAANPNIEPNADIRLMTDGGAWLGGPILRDKLWFVGTWHDQRLNRYILGSYNPDGTQVIDDNVMWNTSGKLSWQMTKSAQLSYFNNTQYKLIGHRDGGTFADGRARQYSYKYPTVNQVKFTTVIHSKMTVDVAYSRFRADDVFGSRPEVHPGDIATMDTTTQVSAVALPTYNTNTFARELGRASFGWVKGSHDLRFGYEYNWNRRGSKIWSTSGLRANFANGVPTSVNTYLASVTAADNSYGSDIPPLYTYIESTQGAYLQDKWAIRRKLMLNVGLRYETDDSHQTPTCLPVTQFYPGACFAEVTAPPLKNFAPRFSLVYDVMGDGKTALKFGANRYDQPISVSFIERLNPLAGGAIGGAVTTVTDQRQWLPQSRCNDPGVVGCDRNGDLIPQLSELGPSPGYVFLGQNAFYSAGVKRPVSNEYTVELQRQLPQETVLSAVYVHRETRRNIASRNTANPPSSWIGPTTVTEVTSGRTVQVWNRPNSLSAIEYYNCECRDTTYNGADITLSKRMGHRWSMLGGASFGRVRTPTKELGDRNDPNVTSNFDSNVILAADRPWSYRLSGVYELPYQIFTSGTWQFQAGPPETTVVLVTNQTIALAQGNQSVQVAPVGSVRYPNTATLDLNIRKAFRLSGKKTLAPRLEIFNATNQATITAWVTQLGPTYHVPSGLQRGRLIKAELAYDF